MTERLVLEWYLHLVGSSLCLSGSPALLQNQRRSMGRQNNSTTEDSLNIKDVSNIRKQGIIDQLLIQDSFYKNV